MATADEIRLTGPATEIELSRKIAARYRSEFVDLREVRIDYDLFHSIPVDRMFRYNFAEP